MLFMKKIDIGSSTMQKEVWRMKENTYKETKHLNAGEFFRYIKDKCKKSMLEKCVRNCER